MTQSRLEPTVYRPDLAAPRCLSACPECGTPIVHQSGCQSCPTCGWGKCA